MFIHWDAVEQWDALLPNIHDERKGVAVADARVDPNIVKNFILVNIV